MRSHYNNCAISECCINIIKEGGGGVLVMISEYTFTLSVYFYLLRCKAKDN